MISVVYGGKRPVFVEDQADVIFYRTVLAILKRNEEWLLNVEPEFIPAAWFAGLKSSDVQKPKGGKGNVRRVVQEFNRLGFGDVISGLVDRDEDELGDIVNLFQLHRYSIENYLLDPVYLYVYLMHHGHALSVDLKQQVPPGGEQVLRQWPGCELQKIADAVIRELAKELSPAAEPSEVEDIAVLYSSGAEIRLPKWLFARRGKTLLDAARRFASPHYFHIKELQTAMQRVGLVPLTLRRVLEAAAGQPAADA